MAVIKVWVKENNPQSLDDLLVGFPEGTRSGKLFVVESEAKAMYERQGIHRHFLGDDEVIVFSGGARYGISNQWGKGNITRFITQSKLLGYSIEETV